WDGGVPVGQYWERAAPGAFAGAAAAPEAFAGGAPGGAEAPAPSLWVVIGTRDRPEDLRRAIIALLASDDPDFELVIVDNASVGGATFEVVRSFPGVKYVLEDRPGLDIARNAG